jgi:hypothetical protein
LRRRAAELGELVLFLGLVVDAQDSHQAQAQCCYFVTSHRVRLTA